MQNLSSNKKRSQKKKKTKCSELKVSDGGDISYDLSLEKAHEQLEERVSALLEKDKIVFVVGGGNDQSYANARALMRNTK